jgi:hypothetical protein
MRARGELWMTKTATETATESGEERSKKSPVPQQVLASEARGVGSFRFLDG